MTKVSTFHRVKQALQYVLRGTGVPEQWFNRALGDIGKENQLNQPYANSVWVMAAIKKVAGPISAVELCCYDEREQELADGRLEAFWRAPALNADGSRLSQADFLELIASWLCLSGELFLILDDTWALPFPDVDQYGGYTPLIIGRPDRMKPLKRGGLTVGWEFTDGAGSRRNLPIEQVIQIKLFNPYDDDRGLGPLQAAMIAAQGDYAAGMFAKNTAEANGDQGVYVVAKNGMIEEGQRQQIIAQLKEKRAAQQRGIFRPAFLTGDITIEDPKVRSVDVAFVSQRVEARKEIAIAFGVPPSFFDPVASYSVGAASDRYVLIEETCRPMGKKICGGISRISTRLAGRPVVCELDWDDHSVMQAVRRERIDSGIKLWNTGMPMKEVSDYLNLDLPEFSGWEIGYLPFSVAPTTTEPGAKVEETPIADLAGSDDPTQEALRALRSPKYKVLSPKSGDCECCSLDLSDLEIRERDPKEVKLWKSIVAKRRETIRAYQSKFTALLMIARREVLQKLEAAQAKSINYQLSTINKAVAADFTFDLGNFQNLFQAAMRNLGANALQTAGEQLFKELAKDDPWSMPQAEAVQFLRDRQNKLAGVPQEVFDRVKATIETGLTNGDPLKTIANNVRDQFNKMSDKRAMTIAQTETAAAYGVGRQAAMEAAGVQWKQWLTSGNSNVRQAHAAMNGATVPINLPFTVIDPKTGEADTVQHPGDPAGAPWNVINCHCVEIAVATGPEPTDPNV